VEVEGVAAALDEVAEAVEEGGVEVAVSEVDKTSAHQTQ